MPGSKAISARAGDRLRRRIKAIGRLFAFNRRRLKAFAWIVAAIYALALLGVWVGLIIPFIGTPIFLASLYLWYIPGILFAWTGFFEFHEFGAAPTGIIGHIVMFLFYAAIAWLLSLPFAPRRT